MRLKTHLPRQRRPAGAGPRERPGMSLHAIRSRSLSEQVFEQLAAGDHDGTLRPRVALTGRAGAERSSSTSTATSCARR